MRGRDPIFIILTRKQQCAAEKHFGGALGFLLSIFLFALAQGDGERLDAVFLRPEFRAARRGGELFVGPAHAACIHRLEGIDEKEDEDDEGERRKGDGEDEGEVIAPLEDEG